jgi:hypothetical protein
MAFPGIATRPRPKQAAAPPRYLSTPLNENMKIRLWGKGGGCLIYTKNLFAHLILFKYKCYISADENGNQVYMEEYVI